MRLGYARISTKDQTTEQQEAALRKAGCDRFYVETASGAKADRPKLAEMLENAREGDTIVIWKLDRLARSVQHLISISQELTARKIGLQSLTDNIDTTTASGKLLFHMLASIAEFERDLLQERREAGIQRARDAGKKFGRKPLSDPDAKGGKAGRLALAIRAVGMGSSIAAASRDFGIARSTIRRHIAIDMSQRDNAIVLSQKQARNGRLNGSSQHVAEFR